MIENLSAFFIIIALGVLFQIIKPGNIDADTARHTINTLVIKFMLPALCFRVISTMRIDRDTFLFPLSAILTVFAILIIAYFLITIAGKFIHIRKKQKGALILTSAFGNVTFFGLPILMTLYGPEAEKYPLMYDIMGAGSLLWIIGTPLASYYGGVKKFSFKESIKNLFSTPPLWAMVLAFLANILGLGVKTPYFILKVLEMMSAPVIPLMIFSVGLTLKIPHIKHIVIAMPSVLIKLIISPLIAFVITRFLGMSGIAMQASIMEASLPVMIMTLALCSQYKLDHRLAAIVTIISIVFSFITIPITAALVAGL
ncbi:MAG: AEC family transporter [Elusimicrobiota bacterium]|jgi:predicted permease|nr:AEC family transporter [Elusimicrobiota bacterium]